MTNANRSIAALEAENRMLREEIRVSREAAEISAHLVVEQFEKADVIMTRLQATSASLGLMNQELASANARLQNLDQMKSDFLSSVSHELRTPLTSIRGFASLIDREFSRSFVPLSGDDSGLQKKAERIQGNLEIILKESERLTRLINDVLDLAKIEAGRVEWHDSLIVPEALIRDATNAAHGMFTTKPEVALQINIEAGLPAFVGDADRLLQVLVNLINNAVKFTDRGTITVKAFINQDGQIQLEVRDPGIGFPPEDAETIFDKFQQAKHGDTLTDQPAGTGLGLAISREIVVRHGGRIWASSEPGKGSVFSLTLPPATAGLQEKAAIPAQAVMPEVLPPVTQAQEDHPARPEVSGKPVVLVVDDDPGIRTYLTQLLQEHGYAVVVAADGEAAIHTAREHCPDLITMDLAMPVMDGQTAILRLRADPQLRHIPIMVISAIPGWDAAGGDLAMGKPLEEPCFLENVHLLLDGNQRTARNSAHFLVLHDGPDIPALAPGNFGAQCKIEFCLLENLMPRIQSGFQGLVVIPSHLIGNVDLCMLQATPSLEVMIMPATADQPSVTPGN